VRRALLALGLALLVAAPAGWADPSFGLGAVSTLPAAFAPLRLAGVRRPRTRPPSFLSRRSV